jgi:uncharacterized protein (DUF924 family)
VDTRRLRDIHRFWFGELAAPDDFPKAHTDMWFDRSEEADSHIRQAYGPFLAEAAAIDWEPSRLSREEAVALVVLLDQFPRNMFRDRGEAFACDGKALATARALVAGGLDRFFFVERTAIALPFEHSEAIADQDYSVFLAAELAVTAPEALRDFCRGTLDYATRHRDVIRRFGRFPHRNALLGRPSTPDEVRFLAEHGRGF